MGTPSPKAGMGKGTVALLIILGAIVLLGGGYALGKYYPNLVGKEEATVTPTVAPSVERSVVKTVTATTDETANWKTYTNNKHKFSVKYPSDWQAKDNPTYPEEGTSFYAPEFADSNIYYVAIAWDKLGHGVEGYDKQSSTTIGLCSIDKWVGTNTETFGDNSNNRLLSAFCTRDNNTVTLEAKYLMDKENLFETTFDKMASTFQFTN